MLVLCFLNIASTYWNIWRPIKILCFFLFFNLLGKYLATLNQNIIKYTSFMYKYVLIAKALGPILPKVCQYGPLAYHSRVITYNYYHNDKWKMMLKWVHNYSVIAIWEEDVKQSCTPVSSQQQPSWGKVWHNQLHQFSLECFFFCISKSINKTGKRRNRISLYKWISKNTTATDT